MRGTDDEAIFAIYNSFKNGLFYEMKRQKLEKCWFCYYYDYPNFGKFHFRALNEFGEHTICNISICVGKFGYKYYDELVDIFKSHEDWLFEIGEYNYSTDTFDIIFKKPIYGGGIEKESYGISSFGIIIRVSEICNKIAEYMDLDARSVYETFYAPLNVNRDFDITSHLGDFLINDIKKQFVLPVCKELPPFKFNSSGYRIPILSKPPIFNPPATICYWTDGTKTVVKCQEGDTYSPEAGLALCYMKKVLGNTSRDLNKELHKYIPEESEDNNE